MPHSPTGPGDVFQAPDEPSSFSACGFCQQPIEGPYYQAMDKTACPRCAQQLHGFTLYNRFGWGPWLTGLGFGLLVAIAGAVVWALITQWSHAEWGLVAVLIAMAVSKAVVRGAGNRRGPTIQVLTIGLSMLGIFIGKGLIAAWVLWPELVAQGIEDTTFNRVTIFLLSPVLGFGLFDLLWYAIAVWEGWRVGRMPRIVVQGPFAPGTTEQPLQFDTVQPVHPVQQPPSGEAHP